MLSKELFLLQYDVENFIFLLKYCQWKVNLNISLKWLVFVSILHIQFHLHIQLPYMKISYLHKNTHAKRCCFLAFLFEAKFRKYYISVKRKNAKANENMNFSFLFKKKIFLKKNYFVHVLLTCCLNRYGKIKNGFRHT